MPDSSRHPRKKPDPKRPKIDPNLPDDEAILQIFPKRLIREVNKAIGHEPHSKPPEKPPKSGDSE